MKLSELDAVRVRRLTPLSFRVTRRDGSTLLLAYQTVAECDAAFSEVLITVARVVVAP